MDLSIRNVSFVQDDKKNNDIVAFIARDSDESKEYSCYAFKSDNQSNEICLEIGSHFARVGMFCVSMTAPCSCTGV